jgi:comEA protein
MSTEIKDMQYSVDSNRGYILRLALGTLAGLIVGWFIFLLPGQTFLASISPFAVAFLVGYNIEIIFSFMDNLISRISEAEEKSEETSKPDESKPKESVEIAPDESTLSKLVEAININTATQTVLERISGIGPATAEAIIQHRQENGPFGKVEDIQKVSRIGADTFEKIKANITVG